MRKTGCAMGAAVLTLWAAGALRSGEKGDPFALIKKAVDAQGGADELAKFRASTIHGKGTFYGQSDQGVPFVGEWISQGEHQKRYGIEINAEGLKFKLTRAINDKKGWEKYNNDPATAMGKERLTEERVQMYASWVATLLPLLEEKGFQLTTLPDAKVEKGMALGVKVSRPDRRDVRLYFDKASSLLVKAEVTVKDVEGGGNQDMLLELLFSDYKDTKEGAKQPMRMAARRDGKPYIEGTITEYKGEGKLDSKVFDKP